MIELTCPLCRARWQEGDGDRQRGSCPGCGAGDAEMFRAMQRRSAQRVNKRVEEAQRIAALCREVAGYLDGTITHFGSMHREALARELRELADKIDRGRR